MVIKKRLDLKSEFRESRGQSSSPPPKEVFTRGKHCSGPYNSFLVKYEDLENCIDSFNTRDLVYFFRETSERSGYKYVISNMNKDLGIMKKLKNDYSVREICGMIEFLYYSEQDYLSKDRLSPNLLVSQWGNTIYADTKLWVEDKYIPKSKQKHQNKEWTAPIDKNVKIGEWE